MKKIAFIGIAIATAMGFTACQKESLTEGQQSGSLVKETFSARFEQTATKTTISDDAATVNWSANDKVYYYSKDGGTVSSFTISADGASASLTLEREEGDTYYSLVYAGNTEPTFTTKTGTSMVFDGVKSAQDGTFQNANVSVARTTPGGSGITFKPVTALVKFTTTRTDIKTIVLTGGNGEKVAGNISVDPTAASPVVTLDGDGSTSISVTIATPAAGTYYIGVIPGTYTKGLVLAMKDAAGNYIGTVSASKEIDLSTGGKMINLSDIDSHNVVHNYFYFKANTAGSTVALNKTASAPDVNFQTSTDGVSWTDYTITEGTGTSMTLTNVGDKLYFRAKGTYTQLATSTSIYHYFSGTGSVDVGGNIMYLLDGTNPETSISSYAFANLFKEMSTLKTASDLSLPATTLAGYCYSRMFYGCKALTAAPALNATTMKTSCYSNMFNGCKALTAAPALPATTLEDGCYSSMFYGCKALTTAPALPATTLKSNCYENMFSSCSALTTAPDLPATTLKSSCYSNMFSSCSALTTAPALPATTLQSSCYNKMFYGCTALTTAPALPATTLQSSCYSQMFYNCKKLSSVTMLATSVSATNCLYNWLVSAGKDESVTSRTVYVASGMVDAVKATVPSSPDWKSGVQVKP